MSKCLLDTQTNVYVCTQNMDKTNGNFDSQSETVATAAMKMQRKEKETAKAFA
jgi:hypothetical protein